MPTAYSERSNDRPARPIEHDLGTDNTVQEHTADPIALSLCRETVLTKAIADRFGGERDGNALASLSAEIRTYNEEVDDKKKIEELRKVMAEAKRLVFLGFHFHKQNVELLSPELTEPDLKGTVSIYGTRVNRSPADIESIQNVKMRRILHGRTELPSSAYITERGCKELFRDFGGILSG
jgi:hypothetical protein